jgi:hypothetical protein
MLYQFAVTLDSSEDDGHFLRMLEVLAANPDLIPSAHDAIMVHGLLPWEVLELIGHTGGVDIQDAWWR